eukprot:7431057-Lingulodinium_polyedra.AAC.1
MREELWTEAYDGLLAIVGEDNFDAGTDMSASEIEVLHAMRKLRDETKDEKYPQTRFRTCLSKAKAMFGTQ